MAYSQDWEDYKNRTVEVDPQSVVVQARRKALSAAATTRAAGARLAWFDETVRQDSEAARTGYAAEYWNKELEKKLREPI